MPLKKSLAKSPYFKDTPARRSTRVSNASIKSSTKKRQSLSSESDFEDGDSSGSDFKTGRKGNKNKRVKRDEISEPEDEDEDFDEDSDDESRPPKTIIIPLPKAREAGDTPYEDGRIHENTMLFLRDLKVNNNREWMRCMLTSTHSSKSFSDNQMCSQR